MSNIIFLELIAHVFDLVDGGFSIISFYPWFFFEYKASIEKLHCECNHLKDKRYANKLRSQKKRITKTKKKKAM